jgi:hypothetical protein
MVLSPIDHISGLITLSAITLSGFHCNLNHRLTTLSAVQLLDEFPLPAGGELEATLIVVRRPVGPADGVVHVRAGVFAVTPSWTRFPLTPGDAHPSERTHTVVTAATGFWKVNKFALVWFEFRHFGSPQWLG